MKIVCEGDVCFTTVKVGDVFRWNNLILMKTVTTEEGYNAVDLETGTPRIVYSRNAVTPADAELTIKE